MTFRNAIAKITIVFLCLTSGCATGSNRVEYADKLSQTFNLFRRNIHTNTFLITSYTRPNLFVYQQDKNLSPLRIYIEGDGFAWAGSHRPSSNPTPKNPLALKLASIDSFEKVAYLARPCQFTNKKADSHCNQHYWTDGRFSEDVIQSMNEAINQLKNMYQASKIELIGYSGGGAVAMLIAKLRDDIVNIRTIAGNLDHDRVNQHHKVTPMRGSLNAIDVAMDVANIPQIHFAGSKDKIVPPFIVESFVKSSGLASCSEVNLISGNTHHKGWVQRWPHLLKRSFKC